MWFIDDMKLMMNVMLHPDKYTKNTMDSIDAFLLYYRATFIPLAIIVIIELLLSVVFIGAASNALVSLFHTIPFLQGNLTAAVLKGISTGVGIALFVLLLIATVIYFWFLIPASIFINSMLYHIIGTLLKQFEYEYDNTATAFIYASAPIALLAWAIVIPLAGILIILGAVGWQYVILYYSLANQQKLDKKNSFWIIFGISILAGIALFLLGF